jgi:hypothetical protein
MQRPSRRFALRLIAVLGALLVASTGLAAEGGPAGSSQADARRGVTASPAQACHPYSLSNPYRLHTKRHKHRRPGGRPASV